MTSWYDAHWQWMREHTEPRAVPRADTGQPSQAQPGRTPYRERTTTPHEDRTADR
jgi:hypothetical protein